MAIQEKFWFGTPEINPALLRSDQISSKNEQAAGDIAATFSMTLDSESFQWYTDSTVGNGIPWASQWESKTWNDGTAYKDKEIKDEKVPDEHIPERSEMIKRIQEARRPYRNTSSQNRFTTTSSGDLEVAYYLEWENVDKEKGTKVNWKLKGEIIEKTNKVVKQKPKDQKILDDLADNINNHILGNKS